MNLTMENDIRLIAADKFCVSKSVDGTILLNCPIEFRHSGPGTVALSSTVYIANPFNDIVCLTHGLADLALDFNCQVVNECYYESEDNQPTLIVFTIIQHFEGEIVIPQYTPLVCLTFVRRCNDFVRVDSLKSTFTLVDEDSEEELKEEIKKQQVSWDLNVIEHKPPPIGYDECDCNASAKFKKEFTNSV